MRKFSLCTVGLAVLFVVFNGFSMYKACDAAWVSGVTIDGNLSEPCWATLKADQTVLQTVRSIPEQIDVGAATDDADCSADFVCAWDAENFYIASWFYDDKHGAAFGLDEVNALNCWSDDSHEWWINIDYADIVNDQSPEYFGTYGWQMMQCFNLDNGVPARHAMAYYHDEMGTSVGYGVTTDVAKTKGFDVPYSTVDGTNFQCEASFKWSGDLMNQKGSGANGDELAFNLGVNDWDPDPNGSNLYMRWTGGDHQNVDGWGKVTLKGQLVGEIIPVKVSTLKSIGNQEVRGIYDIYGRKINARNAERLPGIHFIVRNDAKTVKQMVIR
jgi:hypothetical protein